MKKLTSFSMAVVLMLLLGCTEQHAKTSESTRFLLNTFVSLDIDCDESILEEAFSLCEDYEKLFSKTVETSDVSKINSFADFVNVSSETRSVIERSIYYSKLSGGDFDITICPVSDLWDFEGTSLPDRKEIAEAIKNVDYESIKLSEKGVSAQGKKIDLGGIAKGYIADKLLEFFSEKNVKKGIINLGGNVLVFGEKEYKIGILKPFTSDSFSATVIAKNKSVVTSGVYQRYIEKDGKIYHHILDKKTGYAAETDLLSATVIGDTSLDCDALATICILKGIDGAKKIIEEQNGFEAVFIDKNYNVSVTSGLSLKNNKIELK